MRFELVLIEGNVCRITDTITGAKKEVKATYESILEAIKDTYRTDVYMLEENAKEKYASEMIESLEIEREIKEWLEEEVR